LQYWWKVKPPSYHLAIISGILRDQLIQMTHDFNEADYVTDKGQPSKLDVEKLARRSLDLSLRVTNSRRPGGLTHEMWEAFMEGFQQRSC